MMSIGEEEFLLPIFGHVSPSVIINWHRELLVSRVKSVQCMLDNLLQSDFFCAEDVEIVLRNPTKSDKVRQ